MSITCYQCDRSLTAAEISEIDGREYPGFCEFEGAKCGKCRAKTKARIAALRAREHGLPISPEIIAAVATLPPLDGIDVARCRAVAARKAVANTRTGRMKTLVDVDTATPLGTVTVTVDSGRASWPYLGFALEHRGVVYSTPAKFFAAKSR